MLPVDATDRCANCRCRCRFQVTNEGQRHTLLVSRVTENMNVGVHVEAKNDVGEDSCMIDVRTFDEDENNNDGDDDNNGNH